MAQINNLKLNIIINIHNRIREEIKQNFSNHNFKCCSMKYQKNLSDKFAKFLNNNSNSVKVE